MTDENQKQHDDDLIADLNEYLDLIGERISLEVADGFDELIACVRSVMTQRDEWRRAAKEWEKRCDEFAREYWASDDEEEDLDEFGIRKNPIGDSDKGER